MAEVKKVDKTAESDGMRNVAPPAHPAEANPADPTYITPDTAIEQAAATVPGSEAAAAKATPSDEAVRALDGNSGKSFTQVRAERELAAKAGHPIEPNPPYGHLTNARGVVPEPSGKTKEEMKGGKEALAEGGGYKELPVSAADVAGRQAEVDDRNKAAFEQRERVSEGVELKHGRKSEKAAEKA